MHLSRMRTTRLLTVSQHALHRGVYLSMHWTGGVCPGGVSAQGGVPCDLSHHAFDITCMLS